MANFAALRRRQSSRENVYLRHFSHDEDGRHAFELNDLRRRGRLPTVSGARPTRNLQRQNSAAPPSPDEMAEIMWEMRPRYATSAGELKRKKKRKASASAGPRIEEKVEEEDEDKEEAPKQKLLTATKEEEEGKPPSRVGSTNQFSPVPPEGEDDEEVRESWDSKLTFILATIGYAVGLGNVWRFPYLAQKNGGGAFLIPYWIMLFAEGLPLFLLELAIGQRLRKGAIGVWNQISPFLGGIGIASGIVSFNVALYYNTIIAWCLHYFARSFQYPLPWSECPFEEGSNTTHVEECVISGSTQYFWYRETLNISTDIETPDNFNFIIGGCLLLAWILVYVCIIKGITENPKIIYVTAIYPYVVLIIFFFRGITLEGMEDGVAHFFKPKWERLADPVVWLEAGTQIFFSLGLAFGGLIAYSSYNPVNNQCTRDALIVAFTNCATSMFAGVVIFSIMGFKANQDFKTCLGHRNDTLLSLDLPLEYEQEWYMDGNDNVSIPLCSLQKELDRSAEGTGLAFVLFTEAMNQFPLGNLWAILFFMMLFTLGLDSQFGTLQGVIQCATDLKLAPNLRKEVLTGIICGACFVLSLAFSHGAGNYIFTLFDNFSGSVPLLVIALAECIGIAYFYGLRRLSDDIELMTGRRPGLYWLICWKYISPLAMTGILVASMVDMIIKGAGYKAWDTQLGREVETPWPVWAQVLIACLICMSVLWIPAVAILKYFGITILPTTKAGWFPAEELKVYYELEDHKLTKVEKFLFGMRDDGSEGLIFPTKPSDNVLEPPPPSASADTVKVEIGDPAEAK